MAEVLWYLWDLVEYHTSNLCQRKKTCRCPHCMPSKLSVQLTWTRNCSVLELQSCYVSSYFEKNLGFLLQWHNSPLPHHTIQLQPSCHWRCHKYKSEHLTFKSGYTAVTNIFPGLEIAVVIVEDSNSDTLTKTWQWQSKLRIVVAPSVIGSQESFTEVGITGL